MIVIKRSLSVLDLFLGHSDELSLEEMCVASGINKATVRRIVSTLVECGYLRQFKKRGKYSLGAKFLDFSGMARMNSIIIPLANPHLQILKEQTQESVQMGIWDGMSVFLCQALLAEHPLKVVPIEGTRLAMHATSQGKAIIAEWPEEELPKYFSKKLERYTPNTITDFKELKNQLAVIHREGVAYDDEECYIGVRGVAAALKNSAGKVVGSVSIFGPTIRLTREKMMAFAPLVKECVSKISGELGYQGQQVKAKVNYQQ
jgi:IclR family transcriptional regulator, KDG regulon repressor